MPNRHGGRENLEAIDFLRQLNEPVYREHPDVQIIAEESTAWPMVSRPTSAGGLGFGMKWNMGWMHDTLQYMREDPIHRQYHHERADLLAVYAFNENFMLPLSHDEVVHGKGSLLGKMPGDDWQRSPTCGCCSATCGRTRARSCCSWAASSASAREWNHEGELEWGAAASTPAHARRAAAGCATSTALYRARARAARGRFRAGGLSSGSTATTASTA